MKLSKFLNNREIAKLFRDVAAAYEVSGVDRFRIRAYEDAADSIERHPSEIHDLWEQGKLGEVPGIGKSLAGHIDELMRTGKAKHFDHVFKNLPQGMFPLLEISGIGPKTAFKLAKQLGLTNSKTAIARFKDALNNGKIAEIEGFGKESQGDFKRSLAEFDRREDRMLLPVATEIAEHVTAYLKKSGVKGRLEMLGSLRRRCPTVGDVDLAVATGDPKNAIQAFIQFPQWREILAQGPVTARAIHQSGRQVDLKVEPPDRFGSLLQHFTGSKGHNVALRELALAKGYSLSEHGIKKVQSSKLKVKNLKKGDDLLKFSTEETFYRFLGLDWIPPELRENQGEIEAAGKRELPKLVELSDIKGEFHIHSNIDVEPSHDLGASSVEELIEKAIQLKYQYIAISDHNPSVSKHTQHQMVELVKKRNSQIDRAISSSKHKSSIHVFKSMEIDILPDGRLALPDEALALLDFAIVSIHSNFRENRKTQTDRVLRALSYPNVKIFGHPTARQLLEREGIDCEWGAIFEFCKKHHIWLEINGNPQRLDLPDTLIRAATRHKVQFAVGTDSHAVEHLSFMRYGVDVARRGWAESADIVNAVGYNDFIKQLVRR